MSRLFRTILAALTVAFMPQSVAFAQGVPNSAQVVTTCGTTPSPYSPGQNQPVLQDVQGHTCTAASAGLPAQTNPAAGASSTIVTGGTPVTIINGPVNGCYVVNPLSAADQGIGSAENAVVNGVTTAGTPGNGTNTDLVPGQSWQCVPGQSTSVSAVATTSGHRLVVVKW